jgi:3-deoxy-D-manno-octulosonic-acid transferase
MNVAWSAYRLLAPLAGVLAPAARPFAPARERERWSERLGWAPALSGCEAWVHAASLGECAAVGPLTRELRALDSEARFLLTSTTRTGRERLAALREPLSLAPLDAPQAVRRLLSRARPARLIVIETELWPHWLLCARDAGIPVVFVSARLSERSADGYRRLGPPLRELLGGVAAVLCQTAVDAVRWAAVGVPEARLAVCGNLKFDALPAAVGDDERAGRRTALGLDPTRPLFTLGSLRPGEAEPLARAWAMLDRGRAERWQVVAVPRHEAAAAGLEAEARRAGIAPAGERASGLAWRWDARPGVLMSYYAASEAAFVGASLTALGGHNPLEPAAFGAVVLSGPDMSHQRQAVEALERHGGIERADAEHLGAALERLTGDPGARDALRRGALAAVNELRGAARRSASELARRGLWPVQP